MASFLLVTQTTARAEIMECVFLMLSYYHEHNFPFTLDLRCTIAAFACEIKEIDIEVTKREEAKLPGFLPNPFLHSANKNLSAIEAINPFVSSHSKLRKRKWITRSQRKLEEK